MAVYTQIGDDELARFVKSYDMGDLLSFKGIAEGVENTNYMLEAERGKYILTLYEKRVHRDDLPFFLSLMTHLANAGIDCPVPVEDRNGKVLRELADRPAALITFLDGLSIRRPYPPHCRALGSILARLHEAGQSFPMRRPNDLSLKGWAPLLAACGERADTIRPDLARIMTGELDFLQDHWPAGLPEGVIHADLFPDNVFFLGERLSGLIDFYFACTDMLVYDIAICLNAWCFETDASFNITKACALLEGYTSERRLSEKEMAALPLLARGAALRFLLTRSYDWLNTAEDALVTRKDPLEYLRRLNFHQQVKSVGEYGLREG